MIEAMIGIRLVITFLFCDISIPNHMLIFTVRKTHINSLSSDELLVSLYPPVSKASREVENLTERKNLNTPVYGVKEFV